MSTVLNNVGIVFPDLTVQTTAATGGSGTVTGVTATSPLSSSGGTAPVISLTGTVPTSTNLAGGSANQIAYQTAANTTSFLPTGSAGNVLNSNGAGAAPTWGGVNGGSF